MRFFSSIAENGNSVREPAALKIIDRGDGTALINARRRHGSLTGISARGPPRAKPSMAASPGAPHP